MREDIDSSLVTPDGYFMLRKDRVNKKGGGGAILCRNDWKIKEIDVSGNEYKCLWAKVSTIILFQSTIHRPLIIVKLLSLNS